MTNDLEGFDLDLSEGVEDDAQREIEEHIRFNISFYGADYPIETLVSRMKRGDFYVPDFQRSYVWSQRQASRFIESLLYGLPVPGIFLYREPDTGRHLIIDGQQRLKTLQYFHDGIFKEKVFRLKDVASPWRGSTYEQLTEEDRRKLNDAVIHATIFKQEEPSGDDQSIYYVFERINTGGVQLSGQEIRVCLYHGELVDLLRTLNANSSWRKIYGQKPSARLKDQELILRFRAFYFDRDKYRRPMAGFLNSFMQRNRRPNEKRTELFATTFTSTIDAAHRYIGDKAFRPERNLNAAVFDSVMVGLAARLDAGAISSPETVRERYEELLRDEDYKKSYSKSTADEESVETRMNMAIDGFLSVP